MLLLPLQVSIFLIFLIFYKGTKSAAPHGGRENVKRVTTGQQAKSSNIKQENIIQSENNGKKNEVVLSDTKTRSEEEEFSFDPLDDYNESGCPNVPFVFSGMTGKTLLYI